MKKGRRITDEDNGLNVGDNGYDQKEGTGLIGESDLKIEDSD